MLKCCTEQYVILPTELNKWKLVTLNVWKSLDFNDTIVRLSCSGKAHTNLERVFEVQIIHFPPNT